MIAFMFFRAFYSLCRIVFFPLPHSTNSSEWGEKGFGIIDTKVWSPTVPAGSCSWPDPVVHSDPSNSSERYTSVTFHRLRLLALTMSLPLNKENIRVGKEVCLEGGGC